MELTIYRGSNEVGGTCISVRSGDSTIILDVGMPLFDEGREPLDTFPLNRKTTEELKELGIVPDVPGLFGQGKSPDAILLSHAHLDHTGLLNHTGSDIPVYASSGTSKMMLAGAVFAAQIGLPRERFREVEPEKSVQIGPFKITGFPVDHSIYGCMAFLIEAEGKTILYTGDLRTHGRKPGMIRRLKAVLSEKTIDAMLMEGTHFGFSDGNPVNEYQLETEITKIVQESNGLVLASFSPQHVDRLVAFIRAAKTTGRIFVADVYTAFIMHLLKNEIPLPQPEIDGLVQVYVPKSLNQSGSHRGRSKIVDQFQDFRISMETIRNQPDKYLMVFRASMLGDFDYELPQKTSCLYSRWHGYLDQPEWKIVTEKLQQSSGTLHDVHTSGHVFSRDIVTFVNDIQPKSVIPIHTFEPERFEEHFENVQRLQDGVGLIVD